MLFQEAQKINPDIFLNGARRSIHPDQSTRKKYQKEEGLIKLLPPSSDVAKLGVNATGV